MAEDAMVVEVVTPEQSLVAGPAAAVVLRSSDGELTILPGHTPLVTDVVSGIVTVEREEEGTTRLAVHGGFMHVDTGPGAAQAADGAPSGRDADGPAAPSSTRVTLLAGIAELAGDVDVARAEQARSDAEAKVEQQRSAGARSATEVLAEGEERTEQDAELAEAEAALARAELRISVAGG